MSMPPPRPPRFRPGLRFRPSLALVLFAALAAVPVLPFGPFGGYAMLLGGRIIVFAIAAVSLDLILGHGGLVSFGHAAPVLIGAYAVAVLDAAGIDRALWVLPAACLAAAIYALATGAIALRTRGVNFIMITLAFAQMVYFAAGSLVAYGGDDGYPLGGRTTLFGWHVLHDGRAFYYSALVLLVLAVLVCQTALASPFGRALAALRQNEVRARSLGVDAFRVRLLAMVLAAMVAAVAGVLLANQADYISPAYGSWQRSGDLMVMVLLGGRGRSGGPILGAAAMVLLEEGLGRFTTHWPLVLGPLLVLAALFLRRGLAGLLPARSVGHG